MKLESPSKPALTEINLSVALFVRVCVCLCVHVSLHSELQGKWNDKSGPSGYNIPYSTQGLFIVSIYQLMMQEV